MKLFSKCLVLAICILFVKGRVVRADSVGNAQAPQGEADLFFLSDLDGKWSPLPCNGKGPQEAQNSLANLAGLIKKARVGSPASLVVAGGALLGTGNIARFLMTSDEGSRQAARLLRSAGIDVFGLGQMELGVTNQTVFSYLDEAKKQGMVPVASNLRCAPKNPELCRNLQKQHTVTVGGLRIGLLALLPEETETWAGIEHMHGAKVAAHKDLLEAAKTLRKEVDALILILDLGETNVHAALGVARAFEAGGAHLDVLMGTGLDSEQGGVTAMMLSSGTLLVGSPVGGSGITRVRLSLPPIAAASAPVASSTGEKPSPPSTSTLLASAQRVTDRVQADAELSAQLLTVHTSMCNQWGKVVATLPAGGLDQQTLMTIILSALREAAHAEVAFLPTESIFTNGLPVSTASDSDLGRTLPFVDKAIHGKVIGQDLIDLLGVMTSKNNNLSMGIAGLSKADGEVLVNGRPINPIGIYSFVTTEYIAALGRVPAVFTKGKPLPGHLRQIVLQYIERKQTPEAITAKYNVDIRPLWTSQLDLGTDLFGTEITNPPNTVTNQPLYDRTQLNRTSLMSFKVDGRARTQMELPKHFFEVSLRAQYAFTALGLINSMTQEKEWSLEKTRDAINFDVLYAYQGFSLRHPRLPVPFVAIGLESEFNRPDARNYLHLEISSVVGARVRLPATISAQVGVGVRSELLADSNSMDLREALLARARFLVTAQIGMLKRPVIPRLGSVLLGEFLIIYNFTDPGLLSSHELKVGCRLDVAIGRAFYFGAGTDIYIYRDFDNAPGISTDILAGIKVLFNKRYQVF